MLATAVFVSPQSNTPRATTYAIRAAFGNGSGVLIAPNYLLTAAHVAIVKDLHVSYKGFKLPVEVVRLDETKDIALVKVLGMECPCAPIADVSPAIDEKITTVGFPMEGLIKTQITTQGTKQGNDARDFVQYTSPVGPGNSGGGVFNERGELVAIVSSIIIAPTGFIGFPLTHIMQAVSVETIREWLIPANVKAVL